MAREPKQDTLERGLEADAGKPLFADGAKHGTREEEFSLGDGGHDSNAPAAAHHYDTVNEAAEREAEHPLDTEERVAQTYQDAGEER